MPFRPRVALVAVVVLTALVTGVQGRDVNDASLQFQLGTLLFEETRYREALDAFRKAVGADSKSLAVQARIGVVKSALRLGEFIEAQKEANTLKQQAPRSAGRDRDSRRCAVVGGPVRRGAPGIQGRARARAGTFARPSRPGPRARVAKQARRRAERSADGPQARAARRGDPSHRRRDLRAHAPLRAGGRRLRQLRQPAAEQGSQRQGGVVALADSLPAIVRRTRAHRDRRGRGGSAAHRRLPRHRRQGDRQGPRQRRPRRRTSCSTPARS